MRTMIFLNMQAHEVSTDGIEPLAHILPINNIFREDKVQPGSPREEILSNAPLVEEGQYRVPRIL